MNNPTGRDGKNKGGGGMGLKVKNYDKIEQSAGIGFSGRYDRDAVGKMSG